jgi:CHASE2 domain-containing sensor protein
VLHLWPSLGNHIAMNQALKSLLRPSVFVVLIVVGVCAYFLEDVQQSIPFLYKAQLKAHQLVSDLMSRKLDVQRVAVVEVDDEAFWSPPVSGIQPTNRKFLANLAKIAADNGASAVAIDFQLKSPSDLPGDDPIRKADNAYLLKKVREITAQGKPVILSMGLKPEGDGWKREPNIYFDNELPPNVFLGHINMPLDHRQIPLVMNAKDEPDGPTRPYLSFAQAIAYSYEESTHWKHKTQDDWRIRRAQSHDEFVYGGFWPRGEFLPIPATKLLTDPEVQKLCNNRIVIIGGTWHQYSKNSGPPIDSFESSVGLIPGVYMHANYVEALLSSNFEPGVPQWAAIAFDVVLAVLAYIGFGLTKHRAVQATIISVMILPLLLGYLMLANFGIYLDFALPLLLISIHLGLDDYFKLRQEVKKGAAHA